MFMNLEKQSGETAKAGCYNLVGSLPIIFGHHRNFPSQETLTLDCAVSSEIDNPILILRKYFRII